MGAIRRLGTGACSDFCIDTVLDRTGGPIAASASGAASAFVLTAGIEHDRPVIATAFLMPSSIGPGSSLGQETTANAGMGDSQPGCRGLVCFPGLQGARAGDGRDRSRGLRSQIIRAQTLGAAIIGDDFNTGHIVSVAGLSGTVWLYRPFFG